MERRVLSILLSFFRWVLLFKRKTHKFFSRSFVGLSSATLLLVNTKNDASSDRARLRIVVIIIVSFWWWWSIIFGDDRNLHHWEYYYE